MAKLAYAGDARRARLDLHVSGPGAPQPIFWEFSGEFVPPDPGRADLAALALLFPAMAAARPLHIDAAVSRALIAGLEEFQEAWSSWRPGRYRPVPITAATLLEDRPRADDGTAVLLFSGGLDSTSTLLRHATGACGLRRRRILAGVLVQGFDIPLDRPDWFARAEAGCRATLAAVGVAAAVVRTNWRDVACPDWEDAFGAGMAAVLHAFRGIAGAGMVACDHTWAILRHGLPWGSSVATNPLLGTPDFPFLTDGAGESRIAAAARVAAHPTALAQLRVCYAAPETGLNCGRCVKCRRRQLQLRIAGAVPGASFPAPQLRWRDVVLMPLRRRQLIQLREIRDSAAGWPGAPAWIGAVRIAIALNRLGLGEVRAAIHAVRARMALRTRLRRAGWLPARRSSSGPV